MKKKLMINALALSIISLGSFHVAHAQTVQAVAQACCSTILTDAICCGSSCESGWFNCSATK